MPSLGDMIRAGDHPLADSPKLHLSDYFDEEPVPLDVFIKDKNFMRSPQLSPVQYEAVRHAEQIYFQDLYVQMVREFSDYWTPVRFVNFLDVQWGKGSGKDHICRVASMRIAYLLVCLKSPQDYYEMPPQDSIHLLNVASSSPQAYRAFFKPITEAVKTGWFKDRCAPSMNSIKWDKNVESISGHSDAESQEGLNLMLGVADEIDAFKTKEELERHRGREAREPVRSAEGILKMMRTSASTRFPLNFKIMVISYPRYKGSTIQKRTNMARADVERNGEKSRRYVGGPLKTWDVNPRISKLPRVTVAGSDEPVPEVYVEDYEEDPIMARAMYECKPAGAINPYFRNELAIMSCFRETVEDPVTVDYVLTNRENDFGVPTPTWDPVYTFSPNFRPRVGAAYALHGDIAISGDRAGIAMSHVWKWEERTFTAVDSDGAEYEQRQLVPYVRNDFVFAYEADIMVSPAREVQIRWFRDLAYQLIRLGFAIVRFTFDGFQSTDSMQQLEFNGVESERVSTDMNDEVWKNLRDLAYDGRVQGPYSDLLTDELLALQRQPNGRIDHPPGGSKDLADAYGGSILGAIVVGGYEGEDQAEPAGAIAFDQIGPPVDLPLGLADLDYRW